MISSLSKHVQMPRNALNIIISVLPYFYLDISHGHIFLYPNASRWHKENNPKLERQVTGWIDVEGVVNDMHTSCSYL